MLSYLHWEGKEICKKSDKIGHGKIHGIQEDENMHVVFSQPFFKGGAHSQKIKPTEKKGFCA